MRVKRILYWLAYIIGVTILCSLVDSIMGVLILVIGMSIVETTYPETIGKLPSLFEDSNKDK